MNKPLKLGVNIDHVATLRQARGTDYPDTLEAAETCAQAGAVSITAHLREDRRHIQDADVYRLSEHCPLPINLEMANAEEIVQIALDIKPAEVCLVPEKRKELTTEGGLDVIGNFQTLENTVRRLQQNGSEVSLFVEANREILKASADTGARVVELHTGSFCDATSPKEKEELLQKLVDGAEYAHSLGLQVNAGHGINLDNLPGILKVPHLDTLNIGHSIVARAVFIGLENAVREMIQAMGA
ncbi:pyridoxine 5'-phosphate synthase [Tichowtungia aerotolerans]|uniref:Pyridoxine 5'-phosphate synthase n=1 Tax=Tichowtungia aerotolerans TaxID=2697043 RepID=A0A6P1MAU5_9BACT|nr:pyridoxine 5'-phosphate synthase [Tichowtungia aerotolerans]QHI69218.1 pyridoxine 5'-phosphate synthase [Tichowtungia aerotolerans]